MPAPPRVWLSDYYLAFLRFCETSSADADTGLGHPGDEQEANPAKEEGKGEEGWCRGEVGDEQRELGEAGEGCERLYLPIVPSNLHGHLQIQAAHRALRRQAPQAPARAVLPRASGYDRARSRGGREEVSATRIV